MNPALRTCRIIAFINAGLGGLVAVVALAGVVTSLFRFTTDWKWLAATTMLGLIGAIAGVLLHSGESHLRRPNRENALTLASNSSVLVWVGVGRLVDAAGGKNLFGEYCFVVALGIAYLTYRLFLKPTALRAFPTMPDQSQSVGSAL